MELHIITKQLKAILLLCLLRCGVLGLELGRDSHGVDPYEVCHIVTYNRDEGVVDCTCKMFLEVGILCSHCLRVLHACCVEQVSDQ